MRRVDHMQNLNKNIGAGLGLRPEFLEEALSDQIPEANWFEISPENYINRGGKLTRVLDEIAEKKPIIAHGLSLSIGSTDPLDWDYLKKLKAFLHKYKIPWFSDHLCFSSIAGHEIHELLPLPFTREAIKHTSERARIVQDFLEVPFALENISFYAHAAQPEMMEQEFLSQILEQANISLMLDVNNAFVNGFNHDLNPKEFLDQVPLERTIQIHIAGHEHYSDDLIIDTHGAAVRDDVWDLLDYVGQKIKLPPVLIERDSQIPEISELRAELKRAQEIYDKSQERFLERAS